ncbi:MAG: hypothetical protein IM628_10615 [Phenylobacterium sp.]|uniref:hypothetical protein n=1 Tax=Phenylobacterium sp. TaxID=1871053 RepID=UPI0025E7D695|nr:hypothetical protein [Phenylobacterium sp.]MCA6305254.1 hypothetical protein [Phenylobacterium sp.]
MSEAAVERARAGMRVAAMAVAIRDRRAPDVSGFVQAADGTIALVVVRDGDVFASAWSPWAAWREGWRLFRFTLVALWRGRRWRWDR